MSERIGRLRRVIALALFIALGCTGLALADPELRCVECDGCRGDLFCGLCINEALRHDCGSYGPKAYCTCDHNVWDCFCDRTE